MSWEALQIVRRAVLPTALLIGLYSLLGGAATAPAKKAAKEGNY